MWEYCPCSLVREACLIKRVYNIKPRQQVALYTGQLQNNFPSINKFDLKNAFHANHTFFQFAELMIK